MKMTCILLLKKIGLFVIIIPIFIITASPQLSKAITYTIQKDLSLYGYLDQNDIPDNLEGDDIGAWACGPTAAVNSFIYLENKYSSLYDNKLVADPTDYSNLIATAQTLISSAYMDTTVGIGTWVRDFAWGKYDYINDVAPGTTIFDGEAINQGVYSSTNLGGWTTDRYQPSWLDTATPSWSFLYSELKSCEDVEILLNWTDSGHYLTLTSFTWNDANDDGIIQQTEGATIDYINPDGGIKGESSIWQTAAGGYIYTNYAGSDAAGWSYITMAIAESPVPEPSTMLLLGFGLVGLAIIARKRMKA